MNTAPIKYFNLWALAALIICSLPVHAQQVPSAFTYISNGSLLKQNSSSVSSWKIQLNNKMTQQAVDNNFELAMPDGEILVASVKSHKEFDNGDVQLQAGFGKDGHVILTVGATVTYGSITSSTHNYSLSVDESGSAVLIDNQTLPADGVDLSDDIVIPEALVTPFNQPSMSPQKLSKLQAEAGSAGMTYIDILFVYSVEFRGLFSSPETRINQLIAFSNASFENSGILINLRMVGAVEIGFANGDSNLNLLNAVSANTGVFSSVPQMRDELGADLVAALGTSSAGSASGIAFLLTNSGPKNPFNLETARFNASGSSGFSFTRLSLICCDSVFTHEIGHNLGSGHEGSLVNADANISRCDSNSTNGGFTGFSCGHGNTEPNLGTETWGTMMSNIRAPDPRNDPNPKAIISYRFSNLDNTCEAEPCGIAPGLSGPEQAADNRTSFNITRVIVSDFRDQVESDPNPQPNPDSPEGCSFFLIESTVVCI